MRSSITKALVSLVVLAAALGGGYYYLRIYLPNKAGAVHPPVVMQAHKVAFAAEGSILGSFPKELILVPYVSILSSGAYESMLPGNAATSTAIMTQYSTASSTNDVLKAYVGYAQAHSYPILRSELRPDGVRFISFVREADIVSATISTPSKLSLNLVSVVVDMK